MTIRITSLAAAAALLIGSATLGVAQTPGKSDDQMKSNQMQNGAKSGQTGMTEQERMRQNMPPVTTGTGASAPVLPQGPAGSASGTSGTDKAPGTPSHKSP